MATAIQPSKFLNIINVDHLSSDRLEHYKYKIDLDLQTSMSLCFFSK